MNNTTTITPIDTAQADTRFQKFLAKLFGRQVSHRVPGGKAYQVYHWRDLAVIDRVIACPK